MKSQNRLYMGFNLLLESVFYLESAGSHSQSADSHRIGSTIVGSTKGRN